MQLGRWRRAQQRHSATANWARGVNKMASAVLSSYSLIQPIMLALFRQRCPSLAVRTFASSASAHNDLNPIDKMVQLVTDSAEQQAEQAGSHPPPRQHIS